MTAAPALYAERHWSCPNCSFTDVTNRADVHTRLHACRGLGGLMAPMVQDGIRARVVAVERDDVVGKADGLRWLNGRPIRAVELVTDDTQSVVAFAETAVGRIGVDVDDARLREHRPGWWRLLTAGFKRRLF